MWSPVKWYMASQKCVTEPSNSLGQTTKLLLLHRAFVVIYIFTPKQKKTSDFSFWTGKTLGPYLISVLFAIDWLDATAIFQAIKTNCHKKSHQCKVACFNFKPWSRHGPPLSHNLSKIQPSLHLNEPSISFPLVCFDVIKKSQRQIFCRGEGCSTLEQRGDWIQLECTWAPRAPGERPPQGLQNEPQLEMSLG